MGLDGSASMATQGFGAGMSTVGAYYTAKTQKSTLNSEAEIADTNARLTELTAQSALLQGQRQEQASKLRTRQLKSGQRVAMAANGISLGSDSAISVLTTTDVLGEVDANTINANAARSAWGYRTQGLAFKNQALMKRTMAGNISPVSSALGTLLTSASSLSDSYYKLDKAGGFDKEAETYGPQLPWVGRTFGATSQIYKAIY